MPDFSIAGVILWIFFTWNKWQQFSSYYAARGSQTKITLKGLGHQLKAGQQTRQVLKT